MISVQNLQQQLSGSKNILLLLFFAFTIQSCSVFENIFGGSNPPPPPPIEDIDKDDNDEDVVDVPVEIPDTEVKDTIVIPPPIIPKEQINIAILLPFQLDKMDAGSNFPSAAENSIQLYKGIKYALEEANFDDKELNVYVLDNQGNEDVTVSLLQQSPFPNVDAVIGPLYPNVISKVSNYAKENKITFISPLASSKNLGSNNPYIISSIANTQTRYKLLFDFIEKEFVDPNVGVFYQKVRSEENAKDELVNAAQAKGIKLNTQADEGSIFDSVGSLLEKGRENIIITSASDRNDSDIFYFNNFLYSLNEKGKTFSIKVVATKEWNDVKSFAPEKYPNLNFYLLDRFLDGTNTSKMSEFNNLKSKNNYTELHIYNYQGYDLMSYIIELVDDYGKDFTKHLYDTEYQGIQTNFKFDKLTTDGGLLFYDNKNINILRYNGGTWQKVN